MGWPKGRPRKKPLAVMVGSKSTPALPPMSAEATPPPLEDDPEYLELKARLQQMEAARRAAAEARLKAKELAREAAKAEARLAKDKAVFVPAHSRKSKGTHRRKWTQGLAEDLVEGKRHFVTIEELAKVTGAAVDALTRDIQEGRIPAAMVGGTPRISVRFVEKMLRAV